MSCFCCDFKSAVRPLVVARREEEIVETLPSEESKCILDEALGSRPRRSMQTSLSARVVKVAPAPLEQPVAECAPPRMNREGRGTRVVRVKVTFSTS